MYSIKYKTTLINIHKTAKNIEYKNNHIYASICEPLIAELFKKSLIKGIWINRFIHPNNAEMFNDIKLNIIFIKRF